MTLDPPEVHVAARANEVDEWFPKIAIGDGLALAVDPAALEPAFPPTLLETIDDVGRVTHHLDRSRVGEHRLIGSGHLHALVGGVLFGAGCEQAALHRPSPTPRPRIATAGTIGVGDDDVRITRQRTAAGGSGFRG